MYLKKSTKLTIIILLVWLGEEFWRHGIYKQSTPRCNSATCKFVWFVDCKQLRGISFCFFLFRVTDVQTHISVLWNCLQLYSSVSRGYINYSYLKLYTLVIFMQVFIFQFWTCWRCANVWTIKDLNFNVWQLSEYKTDQSSDMCLWDSHGVDFWHPYGKNGENLTVQKWDLNVTKWQLPT